MLATQTAKMKNARMNQELQTCKTDLAAANRQVDQLEGQVRSSIMVIDDDSQVRTFIRELLEGEGYEVREAGNGKEGVKAFRQRTADLVLCDIFMPEKDGLQTIRELQDEFGKVKIVAISGGNHPCGQVDFLPLARKCGASATLHKPLAPKSLLGAVRDVLGA
jgi:CheY-like chemotaxis protein